MSFYSNFRPSNFFQQIGKQAPILPKTPGHVIGIVYDIEYKGTFNIYKVYDSNGREITVPPGAIIARIIGVHDGMPATDLPIFFPFHINQEIPIVGSKVWIISDSQGEWFWESIVDRSYLSQSELDEIEDKFGGRKPIINSANSYENRNNQVDITNSVDPKKLIQPDYLLEFGNGIDVERRSGAPKQIDIVDLRKLPGELGLESRYRSGLLFSYGESNNSIIYLYNTRSNERVSITDDPIVMIGSNVQINELFKKVSAIDSSVYPEDNTKKNFVVINSEYLGLNSNSDLLIGSLLNLILSSENVVQKALENFKIFGKNIRIEAENSIELVSNNSKIILNSGGISIYTSDEVKIHSDNDLTANSNKDIQLQCSENFNINSPNIIVGNVLKVRNNIITLGRGISKLLKNTFVQIFNTHVHTAGPVLTTPPVLLVTPGQEQVVTTQNVNTQ